MERIAIYIDGGNFYHLALRKLGIHEEDFDFSSFASFLAGERPISEMGLRYYIGTVREREGDPKSRDAMAHQVRFFTALQKAGWEIKTSKLRERSEKITVDRRVEDTITCVNAGSRRFTSSGIGKKA